MKCKDCKMNFHKRCAREVGNNCLGEVPSLSRVDSGEWCKIILHTHTYTHTYILSLSLSLLSLSISLSLSFSPFLSLSLSCVRIFHILLFLLPSSSSSSSSSFLLLLLLLLPSAQAARHVIANEFYLSEENMVDVRELEDLREESPTLSSMSSQDDLKSMQSQV